MREHDNKKWKSYGCSLHLHRIDDSELTKMETLYWFYDYLYKINRNNIDLLKKTCDKECNHKKTCVQIFNENINKYSNNRIKLCTELEQFRQKYIDSHECDKCLDVPFLNNLPNEVNAEKGVIRET